MKKVRIFIIGACMLWYCGAYAQENQKVAVFDPAGNAGEIIKEIVREEISSMVVNTKGYTVLERALIQKVLEENKFQMGGLVDDSQIGEIGKRMGANKVLISTATTMGVNYHLSFKLIDVQTASIEKQKTGKTNDGENDITDVAQSVVYEMLTGEKLLLAQQQTVSDNTNNPVISSNNTKEKSQNVPKRTRNKKITVTFGSVDFIKKQKVIQFIYTYKNMTVGEMLEVEYVEKKVSDYNQKDEGKGDHWKEMWINDRTERYVPKFEELFVKNFEKGIVVGNSDQGAKYRIVVNTDFTEPGFNVGVVRKSAAIDLTCTVFNIATGEHVATIEVPNSSAKNFLGLDFDTGFRIQECYAKAGRELAKFLINELKNKD
ncbi:MAG: penicillin-binding protein activator LpoB [Prevotellaceae bacterium]|jgi:hypothetical protein|nr:penicillin-binding protein activator LpoB [Prevotellaceae bacterium]